MAEEIIQSLARPFLEIYKELVSEKISKLRDGRKWEESVKKALNATEGLEEEIGKDIFKRLSVSKFASILDKEEYEGIYKRFILTLAMELDSCGQGRNYAIPLGVAVLDYWFKMKKIKINNSSLNLDELQHIIENKEKLYRNYFMLFDDSKSMDKIRIFYPKNGESWISWKEEFSIDIRVNLSKGFEYGFVRTGFDYYKLLPDKSLGLKLAYIDDEKELLRFETYSGIEGKVILWAR